MTDTPATIFIVDDDPSARRGLSRLINAAGMPVESYGSARDFLDQAEIGGDGCIILDVKMPELTGIELQAELIRAKNAMSIIFVSGHSDIPIAAGAMKKGAVDFLTKPVDQVQLFSAIDEALKKTRANRRLLSDQAIVRKRVELLTPREYTVLEYVISGMPNKIIADSLNISEDTVKIHRGRVMKKMQAESLPELVRFSELLFIKPVSHHS